MGGHVVLWMGYFRLCVREARLGLHVVLLVVAHFVCAGIRDLLVALELREQGRKRKIE